MDRIIRMVKSLARIPEIGKIVPQILPKVEPTMLYWDVMNTPEKDVCWFVVNSTKRVPDTD